MRKRPLGFMAALTHESLTTLRVRSNKPSGLEDFPPNYPEGAGFTPA